MDGLLEKLKRHAVRIGLGIAVLVVFLLHATDDPGGPFRWSFIDQMENLAYDARLVFSMPRTIDPRIVIVDIDEKSLGVEGRWPWSRDRLATMLTELFEKYKVALVGFDVVFAEPDDSSGLKVLEHLAGTEFKTDKNFQERLQVLKPSLDNDARFAAAIKKYPVVLGYYFNDPNPSKPPTVSGELPPPTFVKGTFQGRRVDFIEAAGYGANLAEYLFCTSAECIGSTLEGAGDDDAVERAARAEAGFYLPDDLLVKADIATMAASLEGRSPFLDHEFADWAASLPQSVRVFTRGNRPEMKALLKRALEPYLPKDLLYRRKQGFSVPVKHWMRHEIRDFMADVLTSSRFRQRGLVTPAFVEHMMVRHFSNREDHGTRLWSLLCLELWFRTFIDRREAGPLDIDVMAPADRRELRYAS